MKTTKFNIFFSLGLLFSAVMLSGCSVFYPGRLSDRNGNAVPEPIPVYGDSFLFSETRDDFRVGIRSNASDTVAAAGIATYLSGNVAKYGAKTELQESTPRDIEISFESKFKEVTAAPKCRMYNTTSIGIVDPDGQVIAAMQSKKSESQETYADALAAKNALIPAVLAGVDNWLAHTFKHVTEQQLGVSVLRFKASKSLVELDVNRFEKEYAEIAGKLRNCNGIRNVRVIEADKGNRIVSIRVLYQKDKYPSGLAGFVQEILK